jgi:protein-disulfide isomerase
MGKKMMLSIMGVILFLLSTGPHGFCQEDRIKQVAIETFKTKIRLLPEAEVRFLEKRESPIPNFYSVKLLIVLPDKEVPAVIYVDKTGEKVFIGNLFVKGENVTAKEAGPPRPKKIDMNILEMGRSPSIGDKEAKVTIVEFSNFQCPHCMDSWIKLQKLIEKHPKEIKYIFKHFPFQPQGKTFELSEMAAAAQEVSHEAFWTVHDFLFTDEGQNIAGLEKGAVKQKIEEILKGKGYDAKIFQSALVAGRAKERVLEDMALGNRLRVTSTPTKIVNGDMIVGSVRDNVVEQYLRK